jgi:hypothetical protein
MKENFFNTLFDGLDAFAAYLVTLNATEPGNGLPSFRETCSYGGVDYGETKGVATILASYKGKRCTARYRRVLVISVYRMESGRYEFTVYIA